MTAKHKNNTLSVMRDYWDKWHINNVVSLKSKPVLTSKDKQLIVDSLTFQKDTAMGQTERSPYEIAIYKIQQL